MHSEHLLFDEAVRSKGMGQRLPDDAIERNGIFIKDIIVYANNQIEWFRRSPMCQKIFPPVVIDVVDNPLINSRVFIYKGIYIIALYRGAINTIKFLFTRLLSDRNFLPQIGDVQNELTNLPVYKLTKDYSDLEYQINNSGYELSDFMPRDSIRQEVAGFMAYAAIEFLMLHEFRHLEAGHLDYVNRGMKGISFIDETTISLVDDLSFADDPNDTLKRQSLEMDADNAAAYRYFKHWCELHVRSGGLFAGLRHLPRNDDVLLFIYIACAGLFRVLDPYDNPSVDQWRNFDHPPTIVRRLVLIQAAYAYLQETGNTFLPSGEGLPIGNMTIVVEHSLERVWGCEYDENYARQAWREGPKHYSLLKTVFGSIHTEIKQFSYTNTIS